MKRTFFRIALLVWLGSSVLGFYWAKHSEHSKTVEGMDLQATYLRQARAISPFKLVGIDNQPYTQASLKGHWTLMFFGFTHCGYICPTTMAELSKMMDSLKKRQMKNLPQVVMISIDPKRDDLDKLKQYVHAFNPAFFGARGEEEQIKTMTKEVGVAFIKVKNKEGEDSSNYDMQHSGAVMLFNPQGELQAFFTSPHHADAMAEDLQKILELH